MAAINYGDYGGESHGGSLTALLNWAGAFLSILLIAGLATWGWKLWVRDVAGVPVVRALEGPMRVAPAEPGGLASNYQGLTVNRIAEEQVEAAPAEQVVLAPQPTILDEDEDLAMAALPPVVIEEEAAVASETPLATPEIGEPLVVVNDAAPQIIEDDGAAMASVLPDTGSPETVLPETTTLSATDLAVQLALGGGTVQTEANTPQIIAAAHVPSVTPRPLVRPANLRIVTSAPTPAAAATPGTVDPATIPAGTRLVQLGAYADRDVAAVEWQNRMARFGDYMVGKAPVVQEAETGGRSFYRLRAMGFSDLSDARRFCSVLVAEGANCIPVVHE